MTSNCPKKDHLVRKNVHFGNATSEVVTREYVSH